MAEREARKAADQEAAFAALDDDAVRNGIQQECGCCFGEGAPQTMGQLHSELVSYRVASR